MTQDFASRANQPSQATGWPKIGWFVSGFALGLFAAFLFYLWRHVPPDTSESIAKPTAEIISDIKIREMDYSFYDLFPRAEVPVVEEYNRQGEKVLAPDHYAYLLQAGSFRAAADADALRAELILQGLTVFIKEVEHKDQTWHRVLIGPINTELELGRMRNRLAELNIESIALRVPRAG